MNTNMNVGVGVGDKVLFGRRNGEQTAGTVLKVNRTTVVVRQDEARGTLKSHLVGTKWKVASNLVTKVEGGPVEAPKAQRPEADVLRDILECYAGLSPENLTCDGELPRHMVVRRAAALRANLRSLFTEIGRQVTEGEAYRSGGHTYYGV